MNGFFGGMNKGCGCDNDYDHGNVLGGCNCMWIILLLLLCCGNIDCNCLIWIIILMCLCGGNGFGTGCGN